MPDSNELYLNGAVKLLDALGSEHAEYLTGIDLQGRLAHLVLEIRRRGSSAQTRVELLRVLNELNQLALTHSPKRESFFKLSGVHDVDAIQNELTVDRDGHTLLFSGAILYCNLLRYATFSYQEQIQANELAKIEIDLLLDSLGPDYWLDFRGGDLLIFLNRHPNERQDLVLTKLLLFGLHLKHRLGQEQLKLGLTLHWEENAIWRFIGPRSYLIGNSLFEARLLMSFSDGEHFFLSLDAYRSLAQQLMRLSHGSLEDLIGRANNRLKLRWVEELTPLYDQNLKYACEPVTFYDWHKRQHDVYNFYLTDLQGEARLTDSATPNHRVALEYRSKGVLPPKQKFIQRLIEADEVTIVGVTHEGLAKFLQTALELRRRNGQDFWTKLQIVFASDSLQAKIIDPDRSPEQRRAKWGGGKKSVFQFLLSQDPKYIDKWECLEFDGNLPFVGNWFIGESNVSVRIAPLLPGADAKDSFYFEIFQGMPSYREVSDAFSVICTRSSRIVEWNLYGLVESDHFHYHGLVNRKRLDQRREFCVPVVLVLLHAEVGSDLKSILQERTIYNGSSDIDTYSNISGRLTDLDVYSARGLNLYIEYNDIDDVVSTNEFNGRTGIKRGDVLTEDCWLAAAVREINEELGLKITPERLALHTSYYLRREDGDLFFRIFSLKLIRNAQLDELRSIKETRPHANLSDFTLSKLKEYYKERKFNRLLQARFNELFLPIFEKLQIKH